LVISSDSLKFILNFPFGINDLRENGCFDEGYLNGFIKAAKSLTIENLNNIDIMFNFSIFYNLSVIFMFIQQLKKVANKQREG
jgi:UDP-MurNAc hydroxylase